MRALPLVVQFLAAILVADLAQYAVHRAFHQVPLLWRFHAVHHSSRDMDWLAGSRLHVVDAVATRGLVLVPLQLAGFAEPALYAYLVFVSFHAVFIHANVRFSFGALERLLVDAALPPLAPRGRGGGPRPQLRGSPSVARPAVRHRAFPARPVAGALRHRRRPRARGLPGSARPSVP